MKLVYIANARIPTEKAHGIQIMEMCSAFAENGLEVELIVPRRINKIGKDPFEYYGKRKNFSIKKLFCLDLIVLDKYIGIIGLWIESTTFFISVFFHIFSRKADIFYIRDKMLLPLVILKNNFVFEVHTFPRKYFFYRPFLMKVRGMVAITQKLGKLFAARGIKRILIAPDGVDVEKFDIGVSTAEARKNLGLPEGKRLALYAGHLYNWKGAWILAEASRYLPENFEVYFVGGTERDVRNFKARYSDIRNVKIIGHRPHSEMPYWLKAADVLVLPNSGKEEISAYWTSPLKMFEYMASRKPIVASDLDSIREILNEGNAVMVEPDSPKSLAEGIKTVLENKNLAEKISANAYNDIRNYSWGNRANKILYFLSSRNSSNWSK